MVKIDRLINEPYLESEYIRDVLLNKNVSPSDVTIHTTQVAANSIAHLVEVQTKSYLRFLMSNTSRTAVTDKDAESLINSLTKELEQICLYKVYQESKSLKSKENKKDGLDGLMEQIKNMPLDRAVFDQNALEKKIELIGDSTLYGYVGNRNLSLLIDWLKTNNQLHKRKP